MLQSTARVAGRMKARKSMILIVISPAMNILDSLFLKSSIPVVILGKWMATMVAGWV